VCVADGTSVAGVPEVVALALGVSVGVNVAKVDGVVVGVVFAVGPDLWVRAKTSAIKPTTTNRPAPMNQGRLDSPSGPGSAGGSAGGCSGVSSSTAPDHK
jgi:hypothetical protein